MTNPNLFAILARYNPWLEHPERQQEMLKERLPKNYVKRGQALEIDRAGLVVGPRQAGKTTWIVHELSTETLPVLLINCEEPIIRELFRSPAEALNALKGVLQRDTILYLEEIQQLENAPLFIKGLVDLEPKRKIVATGSASFQFGSRVRESLAGRVHRVRLLPFSLAEVTSPRKNFLRHEVEGTSVEGNKMVESGLADASIVPPVNPQTIEAIQDNSRRAAWERLVVYGGYPRCWFSLTPANVLRELVEAFVLRDISDLGKIDHPRSFRRLLELSSASVGNLINISEWASQAEIARTTVSRYLDIASQAHLLRLVPPFAGGKRVEVTGRPKVFMLDNGIRNTMFGGFGGPPTKRSDLGVLWENAVYTEILKSCDLLDEVYFWRTKNGAEVDFVFRRRGEIAGIEVKAGVFKKPKLSRAVRSFIDAYKPKLFCVVNASLNTKLDVDGTPVFFVRPWEMDGLLKEMAT